MALKRKHDGGDGDGDVDEETKRRQVEQLLQLESSSSSAPHREQMTGKREMQGQTAEGGLHSIDSDEEEDYIKSKKVEEMNDDDIEGMEDESAVEREGEVQITPFNMKDEREEGFVTKDGNFVFNKKKEEIKDNWLENIDWGKVKERTEAQKHKQEQENEKEDEAEANYDEMKCFREILEMLKPKETVAKALIRIGGGKRTTAQKLKEKKRRKEGKETLEEKDRRENVVKLTGLANEILSRSGHMEIYEETFESIAYKVKKAEEEKKGKSTEIPDGVDDDEALDMFMESSKQESKDEPPQVSEDPDLLSTEVKWEYKWTNEETAEIHGPFASSEMLKWQESGFFDKGMFVRKEGTTEFHDGKRVDFDLYVD